MLNCLTTARCGSLSTGTSLQVFPCRCIHTYKPDLQELDANDTPGGFGLFEQKHVGVCGRAQHRYEICPCRWSPKKMMRKTAGGFGGTTAFDILSISLSCFGANVV
jgi:hypothetical protein